MTDEFWIAGGELLDSRGIRRADLLVKGGQVARVVDGAQGVEEHGDGARRIEAQGLLITPGLVDMHVHLREPGDERSETIESGCRAAAAGGFTAVCAMANTNPVADNPSVTRMVREKAEAAGICEVIPAGSITKGLGGQVLAPMGELADDGVRLFSDDGRCLQSAELMRRALEYADQLGCMISNHAEDEALVCSGSAVPGEREGVMNEGTESARLGLPGRPWAAEAVIVQRDLTLAEMTGARLHIPHVSTAAAVSAIAAARERGVKVTAEVTPHHLTLTDSQCGFYDSVFRVNPPLRTESDLEALRVGLRDGVIDAIATDHAPHADEAKENAFEDAPPGMLGLETALGVVLTELVEPGHLSLEAAIGAMSWKPAEILGLSNHGGPIREGSAANLAIIDPSATWVVDSRAMKSLSRNSPYSGRQLRGGVCYTIFNGSIVHRARDGLVATR